MTRIRTWLGQCKDCPPGVRRKVGGPGPRCQEHRRARASTTRAKRRASHVESTYSITDEEYNAILESQDGVCYGCGRKPGRIRLAVDHDHRCCNGPRSCGKCVRSLLCKNCNRNVLGRLGDSPERLRKLADSIETWPAQEVLARFRSV